MKPTRYILVTTNNVQVRVGLSYLTALEKRGEAEYNFTTEDAYAITHYWNGSYNVHPMFA